MKKGILISLACVSSGGLFWYAYTSLRTTEVRTAFFTPSRHLKNYLAPNSLEQIKTFLQQDFTSCTECAQALEQQFPFTQKIHCALQSSKCYKVSFSLNQPRFLVNNNLVMTDKGTLTEKTLWAQDLIQKLPTLQVAGTPNTQDIAPFLKKVDLALFDHYAITWNAPSRIEFREKTHPQTIVLAAADTPLARLTTPACLELKNALHEKITQSKGHKKDWIIDVRFKNQLIVSEGGRT